MYSISHNYFIKKPSLMQNFALFATYFRINGYAVYSNERHDLLQICHLIDSYE